MARRPRSTFDELQSTHWGVGLVAGFLVLVVGFVVVPALAARSPALALLEKLLSGSGGLLVWMVAGMCWLASLSAFVGSARRRRLLDSRSGLESLRALSWREFELLVGEAYRRLGYRVEETGLGGADGGVDLILRRDGRTTLVQCKQWRSQKVDARTVREQFGLLTHHGADAVIIASVGEFTRDARDFAQGKPIELLNGAALLDLVDSVRSEPGVVKQPALSVPAVQASPASGEGALEGSPACPRCGSAMVPRTARGTGRRFFGCSRFPDCRGTRNASSEPSLAVAQDAPNASIRNPRRASPQ